MQVVLAVPDRRLRLALELFLDEEPGLQLVGTTAEAAGARALVETLSPDALIMSWSLPGCAPDTLLAELKQRQASLDVIVLGGDEAARSFALAAGASAFVMSWDPPSDLTDALRWTASRVARAHNGPPSAPAVFTE